MDHIYAVTGKNLYRQPNSIKGVRSRRDFKENCAFHKDIGHNTERCMALKDEIERLIRASTSRSFWMNLRPLPERSDLDSKVRKG